MSEQQDRQQQDRARGGIELRVNGEAVRVDVDPEMPILWCLRDHLDLTGAKFGCGRALCGACVVHLEGKAVRACVTPIGAAAGKALTTIEGLSDDGSHPVQQAWLEENVPQCGYCQTGQIMAAVALLEKVPEPTDDDIDRSMAGNICRCGTYPRIRRAIHRAAELLAEDGGLES